MANIKDREQERLKLLEQIEQSEKRIAAQNEKIAVSKAKEANRLKKIMEDEQKNLQTLKEQLKTTDKILTANQKRAETLKKQRDFKKEILEDSENELKSFSNLSTKVKDALRSEKSGMNALASVSARIQDINTEILQNREKGKKYFGEEAEAAQKRFEQLITEKQFLKDERAKLLKQVDAYIDSIDAAKGLTAAAKEELDFKESIKNLDTETQKRLLAMFEQRKSFLAQEKRIAEIQKRYDGVVGALPGKMGQILQSAGSFAKTVGEIGLKWAFILGALALITAEFEAISTAASEFRKNTGILNSQMKGVKSSVAESRKELAALGIEAKDIFDVLENYAKTFGSTIQPAKDVRDAIAVLSANFGISADVSTQVLGIMQGMQNISDKTATAYMLQVKNVAKLAKVAPKQIFEDIKQASERIAKFLGDSVDRMFEAEIGARRMGMSLDSVLATTERLLDFEGSIDDELKAAAMTAGNFNLTKARILASAGKEVEAQKEVLYQLNRGVEFERKRYFEKEALAKAVGKTVGELQRELMLSRKLSGLAAEDQKLIEEKVKAGLDISSMNEKDLQLTLQQAKAEQEMQGNLTKTLNAFKAIGAELGTTFIPLLEGAAEVLGFVADLMKGIRDFFTDIVGGTAQVGENLRPVAAILKGLAMASLLWATMSTYAGVSAALAATGVGAVAAPVLAAAAAAAVLSAGMGIINSVKIGDGVFPAGEGPIVSTREGGIFQGTKNDDVLLGPGLSNKLSPASVGTIAQNTAGATIRTMDKINKTLEQIQQKGVMAYATLDGSRVDRGLTAVQNRNTRNTLGL